MSHDLESFEFDEADREMEKQLRVSFASQAPRAAFARDLKARLRPREPWWARVLGPATVRGWAPALATLLVVAGIVAVTARLSPLGPGSSAPSTASMEAPSAGQTFGPLPPIPSLTGAAGAGATAPAAAAPAFDATKGGEPPLTAAGTPLFPAAAPVFRFTQPGPEAKVAALNALAARSGLAVVPSTGSGGGAVPSYSATASEPARTAELTSAAAAFLARHGLAPTFEVLVKVGIQEVVYERLFRLPDGTTVPLVTTGGGPAGTRVTFANGRVSGVSGQLELQLEQSEYPLQPVAAARARLPAGLSGATVRLVYVAVSDPDGLHGYFEPAYLFSAGVEAVLDAAVRTR